MLDLIKIKDIEMTYILKNGGESYTYIQVKDSLVINLDEQTIKVTLESEKNKENIKPFDIIVTKKADRYWIKSGYFEDESTLYSVSAYKGDDDFILVGKMDANEIMYLHLYCD